MIGQAKPVLPRPVPYADNSIFLLCVSINISLSPRRLCYARGSKHRYLLSRPYFSHFLPFGKQKKGTGWCYAHLAV